MRDTTKADLVAANKEVESVMAQNSVLRKERDDAYQNGYRDALQATDNLARINQTQAGMITYFMQMLATAALRLAAAPAASGEASWHKDFQERIRTFRDSGAEQKRPRGESAHTNATQPVGSPNLTAPPLPADGVREALVNALVAHDVNRPEGSGLPRTRDLYWKEIAGFVLDFLAVTEIQ